MFLRYEHNNRIDNFDSARNCGFVLHRSLHDTEKWSKTSQKSFIGIAQSVLDTGEKKCFIDGKTLYRVNGHVEMVEKNGKTFKKYVEDSAE